MRTLLTLVVFTLFTVSASAQTLNPTRVEFTASPDHAVTLGSQPVVTKYELLTVRQSDTGTILSVTDIGKPTPVANVINVPVPGSLPNNTLLQIAVRTVGPGGATTSVLSDPFSVVAAPAASGKPALKTN